MQETQILILLISHHTHQSMVILYFLSTLAVLALLAFYYLYYSPKKTCESYVRTLRQLGYKVHAYDFAFLGHVNIKQNNIDRELHNDSTYNETHVIPGYDVAVGNFVHVPVLIVISPKLHSHALSADKHNILVKRTFALRIFQSIIPEGLLFSEGDSWRKSKKILSKVFNFDFISSQTDKIIKISDQVLDQHESISIEKGNSLGRAHTFKVSDVALGVFSSVVLSSFLGLEASEEFVGQRPIQHAVINMFSEAGKMIQKDFSLLLFGPQILKLGLKKSHRDFVASGALIRSFIKRKIQKISHQMDEDSGKQPSNIIQAILAESKKEGDEGYSEEKMIDEVITFIFAGSDTTTNLFTFATVLIYSHPQVLSKAREEVNEIIKEDSDITKESLKKLVYLEAIQHETLRFYSPVGGNLPKVAKQDLYFGDIPISKGTTIGSMYRPMLHDPQIFPDPHSYKPERWLGEAKEQLNIVSFAFSGGPRTCIGKHLALLESKILLVKILQRYESMEELHTRIVNPGVVLQIDNSEVKATKFK